MPEDEKSYFELDDSGKIAQKYTDEAFFEAVKENEPASTSEVAEGVGCSRRNADVRLRRLEDEGVVKSKLVGNSLVWINVK